MMHTKALPNVHKGMEFIHIAQLPPDQASILGAWLPRGQMFAVELGDIVLDDCIAYSTYEAWYDGYTFADHFQSQLM
jgi:hypothetical protein